MRSEYSSRCCETKRLPHVFDARRKEQPRLLHIRRDEAAANRRAWAEELAGTRRISASPSCRQPGNRFELWQPSPDLQAAS
jgi:hypothetical protein